MLGAFHTPSCTAAAYDARGLQESKTAGTTCVRKLRITAGKRRSGVAVRKIGLFKSTPFLLHFAEKIQINPLPP